MPGICRFLTGVFYGPRFLAFRPGLALDLAVGLFQVCSLSQCAGCSISHYVLESRLNPLFLRRNP